jgi:hypothetical protein
MTNEELKRALSLLASQNSKLLAKPRRDRWDKFSLFTPLVTGLVITLTSLYITHRFETVQKRNEAEKAAAERKATVEEKKLRDEIAARDQAWQQRLARTELLNKFIPYLAGTDKQASMAIVAISITGDSDLMDAVSRMVPSQGVKEGLSQVAAKGPTEEIRNKASTTLNLLETLSRAAASAKNPESLRSRALQVALGELKRGVKEEPPGSNRGADIDKYNQSVNLPAGTPWSGSFVCWCYAQAVSKGAQLPMKLTASFQTIEQALVAAGRWKPRDSGYAPQQGDLVIFERKPQQWHGGIVVSVDESYVYTIEGNTTPDDDSRQAEAVAGKARPRNLVEGFGDMNFE